MRDCAARRWACSPMCPIPHDRIIPEHRRGAPQAGGPSSPARSQRRRPVDRRDARPVLGSRVRRPRRSRQSHARRGRARPGWCRGGVDARAARRGPRALPARHRGTPHPDRFTWEMAAVAVSNIQPLPHQLEAVYGEFMREPRLRFLLADDPGAGKTIMAGLYMKELELRRAGDRILVVTPASLRPQWARELGERFQLTFQQMDAAVFDANPMENPWDLFDRVIVSRDFLRTARAREALAQAEREWDLAVIDEAHGFTLRTDRNGFIDHRSERYKAAEVVSRQAHRLILMTATPHSGRDYSLWALLRLLDIDAWGDRCPKHSPCSQAPVPAHAEGADARHGAAICCSSRATPRPSPTTSKGRSGTSTTPSPTSSRRARRDQGVGQADHRRVRAHHHAAPAGVERPSDPPHARAAGRPTRARRSPTRRSTCAGARTSRRRSSKTTKRSKTSTSRLVGSSRRRRSRNCYPTPRPSSRPSSRPSGRCWCWRRRSRICAGSTSSPSCSRSSTRRASRTIAARSC